MVNLLQTYLRVSFEDRSAFDEVTYRNVVAPFD